MAKTPPVSLIDRAADAALELAAARPWNTVSLRDIAVASGVDLADLFDAADSKGALVAHVAEVAPATGRPGDLLRRALGSPGTLW